MKNIILSSCFSIKICQLQYVGKSEAIFSIGLNNHLEVYQKENFWIIKLKMHHPDRVNEELNETD